MKKDGKFLKEAISLFKNEHKEKEMQEHLLIFSIIF